MNTGSLLTDILRLIARLILISVAIHFAGKLFGEEESYLTALLATIVGLVIAFVAEFISNLFLGWMIPFIGMIAAIIAWILVIKSAYATGYVKATGIAIMAGIIYILLKFAIEFLSQYI